MRIRNLLAFLAFVLVLTCVFCSALAETEESTELDIAYTTYVLDEIGISVDIPSEYVAFTRDISDDDPNLTAYGLTKESLSESMQEGGLYFLAADKIMNFEIKIAAIDSQGFDINKMDDDFLNSTLSSTDAPEGTSIEKTEIIQHDQAKFGKMRFDFSDEIGGAIVYMTTHNDKFIEIVMEFYSDSLDSEKEAIFDSIVDSIHFD